MDQHKMHYTDYASIQVVQYWLQLNNVVELLFIEGYWNPHTHADPRLATTEFPHPHLSQAKNIVSISKKPKLQSILLQMCISGKLGVWAAGVDVGRAEAEGFALIFSKRGGGQTGRLQARGRSVLNSFPKLFNFSEFQNGCSCEKGPCSACCSQGAGHTQAEHFSQIRKGQMFSLQINLVGNSNTDSELAIRKLKYWVSKSQLQHWE